MSNPSNFSGLTNEQAFAIMNAMEEVHELNALESAWNPPKFWAKVGLTSAVLAVGCIAGGRAAALGLGVTLLLAACVPVVTWGIALVMHVGAEKRLAYLRDLKVGLEQFKLAAEKKPGATATELLATMPD